MPLLHVGEKIINTEQIIKVVHHPYQRGSEETVIITFTDDGSDRKSAKFLMFSGKEAAALWSVLCSLSQKVAVPL